MIHGEAEVVSVNATAVVHEGAWTGDVGRTGIDKRPVMGWVKLANDCVESDLVAENSLSSICGVLG